MKDYVFLAPDDSTVFVIFGTVVKCHVATLETTTTDPVKHRKRLLIKPLSMEWQRTLAFFTQVFNVKGVEISAWDNYLNISTLPSLYSKFLSYTTLSVINCLIGDQTPLPRPVTPWKKGDGEPEVTVALEQLNRTAVKGQLWPNEHSTCIFR